MNRYIFLQSLLKKKLCNTLLFFFRYESTLVEGNVVMPVETKMQFKTERAVPKVS
jgi:hypothetical protein